ncbi:MAG: hypothetical protein E6Q40_09700 [Cupriavidus sp.]|nr:MAG: hypothetical protein E6Q40_09700 [Cupriavidus sp.]
MKRILFAAALTVATVPAFAGVSVSIGEPGFFGQIDIGGAPAPEYVNAQPVVEGPVIVGAAPIYLHVPPGHIKHWRKHCAAYNACGRPVYFVSDNWYNQHYVPYYHEHHGGPRPEEHDRDRHDRHDDHGDRRDDHDHR